MDNYVDEKLKDDDSIEFNSKKFSCRLMEEKSVQRRLDELNEIIIKLMGEGITPHFIWIEQRIDEIIKAMDRYREIKKEIPKEWYMELAQLENEKNRTECEKCQEGARKAFNDFFRG